MAASSSVRLYEAFHGDQSFPIVTCIPFLGFRHEFPPIPE